MSVCIFTLVLSSEMGLLFIPVLGRAWYIDAQPSEHWLNVLARDISALWKFPAWHWPCPFHLKCHSATWTRALATSVGGLINSPSNNQASPTPSSPLLRFWNVCISVAQGRDCWEMTSYASHTDTAEMFAGVLPAGLGPHFGSVALWLGVLL